MADGAVFQLTEGFRSISAALPAKKKVEAVSQRTIDNHGTHSSNDPQTNAFQIKFPLLHPTVPRPPSSHVVTRRHTPPRAVTPCQTPSSRLVLRDSAESFFKNARAPRLLFPRENRTVSRLPTSSVFPGPPGTVLRRGTGVFWNGFFPPLSRILDAFAWSKRPLRARCAHSRDLIRPPPLSTSSFLIVDRRRRQGTGQHRDWW